MNLNDRSDNSTSFPPTFQTREIETNGATIHTRVSGQGPAVVLLHGFATTGDMWAPLAAALVADHTVVVPDLRGLGLSSKPSEGYDKKTQSRDVAGVMDALGVPRADFVTHDIGNMVGYAFAARLCGALCHAGRDSCGLRPVRGLWPGRPRQQGLSR
jgi:pimeloyl-ACP methyl ester carboxylesterase